MSYTPIISDAEIKSILGLSGTTYNALVSQWNEIATEMLYDILNIQDLAVHSVIDEPVKPYNQKYLALKDFPVDITQTITLKYLETYEELTGSDKPTTFYQDPKDIRTVRGRNDTDNLFLFPKTDLLVSYTAGYIIKDTIVFNANASAGNTVNVKIVGEEKTYTFKASDPGNMEVLIGADANETASNFATAIGGTADGATVTAPLGTTFISSNIDTTITNANVPKAIKTCVAYIAGGGVAAKDKLTGVESYTLGQKTVSFRSGGEAEFVKGAVKKYGIGFVSSKILSS